MLTAGTRVVKIAYREGETHPVGTMGRVNRVCLDAPEPFYLVQWDGDEFLYVAWPSQIESQQALKQLFKHGLKLSKRGLAA